MEDLVNRTADIYNTLVGSYKTNSERANIDLLKRMRLNHSKAIVMYNASIKKYSEGSSETDRLEPSINASYVDVIHSYVRNSDNLVRSKFPEVSSGNVVAVIKSRDGKNVISLDGLSTRIINSISDSNSLDIDGSKILWNGMAGGNYPTHDSSLPMMSSDWIDNLTSDEARHFVTGSVSKPSGVDGKPTLINFWANWCGPSNAFKPHWEEFAAKPSFDVDVYNVDVGNDPERQALASEMGVDSFPSLVLVVGDKKIVHSVDVGNAKEDILSFLRENLTR